MTDVSIWMPIVWSDYDKDTSRLSLEQHGVYLMLIKEYWNNGGAIENDLTGIYRSLGALNESEQKNIQFILEKYFKLKENFYTHSRIDEELRKAKDNKKIQQDRTKAATEARKSKQRDVQRDDNVKPDVTFTPSPSPSPSPVTSVTNKEKNKQKENLEFDYLWELYDFKDGKKKAQESFEKVKQHYSAICQAIPEYKKYLQLTKYPPCALSAWLNQERWNNDYQQLTEKFNASTGKTNGGDNFKGFSGRKSRTETLAEQLHELNAEVDRNAELANAQRTGNQANE